MKKIFFILFVGCLFSFQSSIEAPCDAFFSINIISPANPNYLSFQADYQGSFFRHRWDFGDGSTPIVTADSYVEHEFTSGCGTTTTCTFTATHTLINAVISQEACSFPRTFTIVAGPNEQNPITDY